MLILGFQLCDIGVGKHNMVKRVKTVTPGMVCEIDTADQRKIKRTEKSACEEKGNDTSFFELR